MSGNRKSSFATYRYHVTSTSDCAHDTLINTGDQVFSGTVAVNLKTGADAGSVYLIDHIAGPNVQCTLQVTGTGKDAEANPTFNYTGHCDFRGK